MVKRYKHKRLMRHARVRAKIIGTGDTPRISVFRSNKFITSQVIDDQKGVTLLYITEKDLGIKEKLTKTQKAEILGKQLAKLIKEKNIKKVVFDRGGYKYHGRVKALSEGLRSEGLEF